MKQVYKKRPEYLDVVEVLDDTQSIKDVYEMAGVKNASITFDDGGNRIITLEDGTQINIGSLVFKDKKSEKLVVTTKQKLLQFYEFFSDEEHRDIVETQQKINKEEK